MSTRRTTRSAKPNVVSRVLSERFSRSVYDGELGGIPMHTGGFAVASSPGGAVIVHHPETVIRRGDVHDRLPMLRKYAAALERHYDVELDEQALALFVRERGPSRVAVEPSQAAGAVGSPQVVEAARRMYELLDGQNRTMRLRELVDGDLEDVYTLAVAVLSQNGAELPRKS